MRNVSVCAAFAANFRSAVQFGDSEACSEVVSAANKYFGWKVTLLLVGALHGVLLLMHIPHRPYSIDKVRRQVTEHVVRVLRLSRGLLHLHAVCSTT